MRVVFFGTPDVAVPSFDALMASRHDVVAVVTQPDRPRGRGRSLQASAVKERASVAGVDVMQPSSPKEDAFVEALREQAPDALAIVAYGHILSRDVLAVAPAVNVHFSLLPAYRGAAPVQRALMDGATETGVSVFMLEPTVDTGPILGVERIPLAGEETSGDVFEALAPIGARLLVRCLDDLEAGTVSPVPQDAAKASRAPKIDPQEAIIDWHRSASDIVNLVRGLSPAPCAWSTFRAQRLSIRRARIAEGNGKPGVILSVTPLVVAAGAGAIGLVEVQPAGKRAMQASDWVRGARPTPGDVLGGEADG